MNPNLDTALEPLATALRQSFVAAQTQFGIEVSEKLQELEELGPEEFVAKSVRTPWDLYFRAVVSRGRPDLTVEATIQRLAEGDRYWEHFLSAQLEVAKRWLPSALRLHSVQQSLDSRSEKLEDFPVIVGGDWICLAEGRAYLVKDVYCCTFQMDLENGAPASQGADNPGAGPDMSCAAAEEVERHVRENLYLFYSPCQHNHLLFCEKCQSSRKLLMEIYDSLADEQFRLCAEHLDVLDQQIRAGESSGYFRGGGEYQKAKDWRAVVLADYLGYSGDMIKFCRPDQTEASALGGPQLNPWLELREGRGSPKAIDFVQNLSEGLFDTALLAFAMQKRDLRICYLLSPDGPLRVPSCGDIREVKGLLKPVDEWDTSAWQKWIDDVGLISDSGFSKDVTAADILQMAADAAHRRDGGPSRRQPRRAAERDARNVVGSAVFDQLIPDVQSKIVDAQKRLESEEYQGYEEAVHGFAAAFEMQIQETVLNPIRDDPKRKPVPCTPLHQQEWPFKPKPLLGTVLEELRRPAPAFVAKVRELGFNVESMIAAISEVSSYRNRSTHPESRFSQSEARRIWRGWSARNDPEKQNVFARLLPIDKRGG